MRPETVPTAPTRPDPAVVGEVLLQLAGDSPAYLRLEAALRDAVRSGRLVAGATLPPSRALADALGCSRWVVTQAYGQLVAEGVLHARTGSATRVADLPSVTGRVTDAVAPPGERVEPLRYDLRPGIPDLQAFPAHRWTQALTAALAAVDRTVLAGGEPAGVPTVRSAVGSFLARSRATADTGAFILLTRGTRDAVDRLCRVMLARGHTRLGVEDPGWDRLRNTAAAAGLTPVPIPVDEHGLDVEALADQPGVRAVLVTPAHQFPTGTVLSAGRREQLIGWAAAVDGLIIEDDYDAAFRYDRRPVAALQALAPDRVALAGSLSKTLAPAIGLGWLVVPSRWAGEVLDATVAAPSVLEQLTFGELLSDGGYDRYLRAARTRYAARHDALLRALDSVLPDWTVTGTAAGLHVVARPPEAMGRRLGDIVVAARRRGVAVTPLDRYAITPVSPGLVLGYGNLRDPSVRPAVLGLRDAAAETDDGF